MEVAKKLDVWAQAKWHRRWERLPVRFTVWVTIAVIVASLFEIIPTFLIRSNETTIKTVKPYTPLELYGRDIYVSEGCYNCHSQMIRPLFAETDRYGEYSKPGEFVYDRPFQWGSRRIGPDLAREGGKQSHFWHVEHFRNPTQYSQGSVMPEYSYLERSRILYSDIPAKVRAAAALGAPYSDEELNHSIELARAQAQKIVKELVEQGGTDRVEAAGFDRGYLLYEDAQVIALIAYLQRLGTDIYAQEDKGDPAAETPAGDGPAATESHPPPADASGEGQP